MAGILPKLEATARLEGVDRVIPAAISCSLGRRVRGPVLRLTRATGSGFKLLAYSEGSVQEIFVVMGKERREEIKEFLKLLGIIVPAWVQTKISIT